MTNSIDAPRSLKDISMQQVRRESLNLPHMQPLKKYAEMLRQRGIGEVPDFDPMDGGTQAAVLFVFEKPGPMTAGEGGSGFISRNNDDPTANNTFNMMNEAGIPRNAVCMWNLIPAWNGTIKVTSAEKKEGLRYLQELLLLLPHIKAIVLVGGVAKSAESSINSLPLVQERRIHIANSYHPSRRVQNRYKEQFAQIPHEWKKAYEVAMKV